MQRHFMDNLNNQVKENRISLLPGRMCWVMWSASKNGISARIASRFRGEMEIYSYLIRGAAAACSLMAMTGCTGPQMMTHQPSSTKFIQSIPPNAKLYVTTTCNDSVADSVVHARLAPALLVTGKFASVEFGEATPESLQLNLEIEVRRSAWSHRAFRGDFSLVSAKGRIVTQGTTCIEIHETRSGPGGMMGGGGWLAAGEDSMTKTLTRSVINDVAVSLKRTP
jgi:hypothetical protein